MAPLRFCAARQRRARPLADLQHCRTAHFGLANRFKPVKARLGKFAADPDALVVAIESSGLLHLPISASHAGGVAKLLPHHNDPFDRLLVSQAVMEPLRFLTADALLVKYGDMVVPA